MNNYYYPNYQQQCQMPALNGKIVQSADMARIIQVPIGGYGVFPKADLSEIYLKSWNANGTTTLLTFKPVQPQPQINLVDLMNRVMALQTKVSNQKEGTTNDSKYTVITNATGN